MIKRYARQEKLVSQERLKKGRVLIAGVGGLGSFSSTCLALAGIGTLVLVDYDTVEESNLNRQILYRKEDLGKKKVHIAAKRLKELNPELRVIPVEGKIEEVNIPEVDLIIDGFDNFKARYRAENMAMERNIPFIFGAVEGYMGMVTFIDKHTKKLKDFIPNVPSNTPQVLASTVGITASIQCSEAIKYLTQQGDLLRNRLLIYDALSTNFLEVKL